MFLLVLRTVTRAYLLMTALTYPGSRALAGELMTSFVDFLALVPQFHLLIVNILAAANHAFNSSIMYS